MHSADLDEFSPLYLSGKALVLVSSGWLTLIRAVEHLGSPPCQPHGSHATHQRPFQGANATAPHLLGEQVLRHVPVVKTGGSVNLYLQKNRERPALGPSLLGLVACMFSD